MYGRNDNYGYNLPKRVALSLNNFAELLDDPNDEIIFVDYNSSDSSPTFPDAIADTLTDRAKNLLRVIRVRPHQISRGALNPKLKTNEPLARNVGFRRSKPSNRWILSTNTDMIFMPKSQTSLSTIVSTLSDGQYGLPRFEIPETVWESMPRSDPNYVMRELDGLAARLSLRHIVTNDPPHIFDGPGDFQLFLREDLFAIGGADEDMIKGWHVDSNLAKRVSFLRGDVVSLLDQLEGYHCDHTKQLTPAHKAGAKSNSLLLKVTLVGQAALEKQKETWGLHGTQLEEIRLPKGNSSIAVDNLVSRVSAPQISYSHSEYNSTGWNVNTIPPGHILPFLVDFFVHFPPGQKVIWVGPETAFRRVGLDFLHLMDVNLELYARERDLNPISLLSAGRYSKESGQSILAIFDFSYVGGTSVPYPDNLTATMRRDLKRLARKANTKTRWEVLGVNVVGNHVQNFFGEYVGAATAPFSIGLRHGQLMRPTLSVNRLKVGIRRILRNVYRRIRNALSLMTQFGVASKRLLSPKPES